MNPIPPPPRITRADLEAAARRSRLRQQAADGDRAAVLTLAVLWPEDLEALRSNPAQNGRT